MIWMLLIACGHAEDDELAAAVMLVTGQVHIVHDGKHVAAAIGTPIHRDDQLVTGPDGALIVHLKNDHLVRIDADLDLDVTDLVMLDAPPSSVPPKQQLADFLYPEEREALGDAVQKAERVAGWHSRLTAADSSTGVSQGFEYGDEGEGEENGPADVTGKQSKSDAMPMADEPVRPPERTAEERRHKEKKKGGGTRRNNSRGGGGNTAAPPPPAAPRPSPTASRPAPPPAPAPAPEPEPEPVLTAEETGTGGLALHPGGVRTDGEDGAPTLETIEDWFAPAGIHHHCLVTWEAGLGVELETLDVTLRMRDGTVRRAIAGGGLRLPACARSVLEGTPIESDSDTLRFSVDLK